MKSFDAIEINNCTWKTHSDDYYRGYEAGQQSKQAEIDGQFIANCKQTDHIHKLQREKDELQKRIDELEVKNKILGMRLDVIQGVMQKEIELIVQLKGDQS